MCANYVGCSPMILLTGLEGGGAFGWVHGLRTFFQSDALVLLVGVYAPEENIFLLWSIFSCS